MSNTSIEKDPGRVAVVAGIGPGLGASLCRALCAIGYDVAGISRSRDFGALLEKELNTDGVVFRAKACDVADNEDVARTFSAITDEMGPVDVLIYNAGQLLIKPFTDTTPAEFEAIWRVTSLGAMQTSAAVLPHMKAAGSGTIVFTGATASIRGGARFAAFASAKFALRGLAQSLAREHGELGIHVAHVLVDGMIWGPQAAERFAASEEQCLDPDAIAETYLHLINQNRSAWSQELDLRPFAEKF